MALPTPSVPVDPYPTVVRDAKPVGYWRLNEPSGGTVTKTDAGANGTYVNAPTLGQAGALGDGATSVRFNASGSGAGDAGSYATVAIAAPGAVWSIECWCKRSAAPAAERHLLDLADLHIYLAAAGTALKVSDSTTLRITGTANVADGNWHHAVLACDGSTTVLYVDGVQNGSYAGMMTLAGTTLHIGRFSGGGFTWDGWIDEIAIYNRALSAAEVFFHYESAPVRLTPTGTLIALTVNGIDRSRRLAKGSFQMTEQLGSRNSGALALEAALLQGLSIHHGASFAFTKGATTLCAGRIRQPKRKLLGLSHIHWDAALSDYSEAFDRRIVAAVWENVTLAQIVTDVVTNNLTNEGITIVGGSVETGPTLTKFTANYRSVTWCFNELVRRTGHSYWVDTGGVLQFRARSSVVAPVSISDANAFAFSAYENIDQYRNVQYLHAGLDLTDVRTEDFHGDGKQRTFVVAFPVGKEPTIREDRGAGFVTKTVGISGVETGFDWYWNKARSEIVQDNAGTVIATTDTLRVLYQGQFPIIVNGQSDAEITARASIEGTSGHYETAEDDASIDNLSTATEKVLALLNRYGMVADVVEFSTYVDGLHAGQLLSITHQNLGLSGTYLVNSVNLSVAGPDKLLYVVQAIGGNDVGAWQEFFLRLQALGTADAPQDNEVLQLLRSVTDAMTCSDTVIVSSASPERRIGFATVGFSEVA